MRRIANDALAEAGSGGSAKAFTRGFAELGSLPNFSGFGWYSAPNSHGPNTTSYQHDLGVWGFALKVYVNDGHNSGRNTAAIVRTGALHYFDAAVGLGGELSGLIEDDTLNANLALSYFKGTGGC